MPIQMKPENGRAAIEGVPRLAWGTGKDCTFAGALEAAAAVTEHPCSYSSIMGLSGLAFRVRWCNEDTETRWCGSCAVGEMPDEHALVRELTGWSLPTDVQFGVETPDVDAIRSKVVASIDAGQPVIAYASTLDMAVIYGYEDGGDVLLVSDYGKEDEAFRLPVGKLGPMQTYLGEHTEPPPRRDALVKALTIAVRNWRRERHDGGIEGREYWYGDAAFKAWEKDLRGFDALAGETRGRLFHLDGWNLASLHDARKAAVAFLKEHAPLLGGEAGQALERAAGDYQHVVEILEPVLAERGAVESVGDRLGELRLREARALAEVYQFESKAIADLDLALAAQATPTGDEAVILEGVDRYRVMDPMFEPVRVVLSYRGEAYSPAYIQGISGGAFRIGGICPCAPTCACAMDTQDLIQLLGYEVEYLSLCEEGIDPETEVHRVIARVKDETRAGRPAIVWHAFTTAEWDVVCGFDDTERQFLGRGSYAGWDAYATADQARTITCTAICPALGAILVGEKTGEFNAREAELAALREAVTHARSTQNQDSLGSDRWAMLYGLLCYDRRVSDFRVDPPRLPTMGDRYCFGVYKSTHRAASGFLRELAPRYPEVAERFERAAEHFETEAGLLDECSEMLFPGWQMPKEADRETNDRAAAMLSKARNSYARGIDEIEEALATIAG